MAAWQNYIDLLDTYKAPRSMAFGLSEGGITTLEVHSDTDWDWANAMFSVGG